MHTSGKNNTGEEPKLRNTLKEDFKSGGFFKSFRRDFKDIKEYYISEEKHKRLSKMNWFKRIFLFSWWLLKSMILKLAPFRRVLLIIGIFFLVFRFEASADGDSASANTYMIGVLLIIFLLMLELKDKLLAHEAGEARTQLAVLAADLAAHDTVYNWPYAER